MVDMIFSGFSFNRIKRVLDIVRYKGDMKRKIL